MRLTVDALRLSIDARLVKRGSCGRSLIYFRLDVWRKPPPGRFDEKRALVPTTIAMFDLELVDRRWRKPGQPLEVLVRLLEWQADNRTYYAMGELTCPGCGATIVKGKRPNHAVGCRSFEW